LLRGDAGAPDPPASRRVCPRKSGHDEGQSGRADEGVHRVLRVHRVLLFVSPSSSGASASSSSEWAEANSPWAPRQAERWFQDVLTDANTASAAATELIHHARVAEPNSVAEPELRLVLRKTILGQEKLFPVLTQTVATLREAGEKLQLLRDFFEDS
jgi:hypothetical protein